MEMSFFNHALTKTLRQTPINRGTRTTSHYLIWLWAVGASINRGTLRPPVRGHDVKKDNPMLMPLTKDTFVTLSKGQE